jgi:hypothetical protein
MDIYVTWVTPREYTAVLNDVALARALAGTTAGQEVRQLLTRLHAGTLDDAGMTRLGEVIAGHPGLLAEDEENWTSTGHTEVTHLGVQTAAPDPPRNQTRYVASWAEHKDPRGNGAASSWAPMPFSQAKAILIGELRRNLQRWRGTGGSDPVLYDQALRKLEAAAGPLTITLPGHVLRIEDT